MHSSLRTYENAHVHVYWLASREIQIFYLVSVFEQDGLHRGYKTFFMLNSTEHGISTAPKTKIQHLKNFSCFQTP